ncbi:TetR/AcrR family transcriptional regulator [Paenibacillus sp. FSL H7-0357]|uniref:TetR/AcrR family transcriptional regulator n=2 Tax=Paenibacillus sp. FSL H7-0357 TaxID=1536774 RepID=UPI000B15F6CD|nr:TetR/AcrR family transcriptional regulator [Paenibacillus sp. FSL H7-0357]
MTIHNNSSKKKMILQAASSIVRDQGVEHLTLEAVAKAANVSKGGLLYHFPNKEQLVSGMVDELTRNFTEDVQSRVEHDQQQAGKWSRAYIESTFYGFGEGSDMNSVLAAALFTNPGLLTNIQEKYAEWQHNFENDGVDPLWATIARLATDGLWFAEKFGLAPPDLELKERIYKELMDGVKEEK